MNNKFSVGDYLEALSTIRLADDASETAFTAGEQYRVDRISYRPDRSFVLEVIDDTKSFHNMESRYVQEHFKWRSLHERQ